MSRLEGAPPRTNPPAAGLPPREYLFGLTMHGVKLGLQNITALLEAAGNPQDRYRTIHITGSNGKGSVAALLHAMLQAAGYRVGRFTSPHLIDLNERFQINGVQIPEPALEAQIRFFQQAATRLENPPTFFELNTAIAFRWFAEEQVDLAIIEVGMGGRLDSTNVITPIATAITSIDLEHTEYLGDTLEAIAVEKAGIMKPGVPAVLGVVAPGPRAVIEARAREIGAPLQVLGRDFHYKLSGTTWEPMIAFNSSAMTCKKAPLSLAGRYQGSNAAIALALAEHCRRALPAVREAHMLEGLATARWPARMERVLMHPPVIIDVAHNVAGARSLREIFFRCVVVLAVSSDKDAAGMIEALAPLADPLILTEFTGKRALSLHALCAAAGARPFVRAPNLTEAIARGVALAADGCPLLLTGSIYMAGEARRILNVHYGAPPLEF